MAELFLTFKQHLIWALILFVVFFTAFAALFARRQLTPFALGVARVLAGIVVSPFVFIQRAVESVLRFTRTEEQAYRASDQYLLNKAMLVLQAVVIVVAIGLLSAGAVATWNVWVPPSEVRRAAREYRTSVEEQRTTTATANEAVSKLDAEWSQRQSGVVAKFRKDRETQQATARKGLASVEQAFANYASEQGKQALSNVKQIAESAELTPENINETKQRLDSTARYDWWLSEWERQSLRSWNDVWQTKALAGVALANIPLDALRAEEQPTYTDRKAAAETASATLVSMEEQLKAHQEAASLKWKAATWTALGAFVTFLLFVWLWGALTEAGWLAIRVADNVRRMREAMAPQETTSAIPAEVRLPIRNAAVSPSAAFVPPPAGA